MSKYEVITPIGVIEVTADEMRIVIDNILFIKDSRTIGTFNGDKIYGWIERTGESE